MNEVDRKREELAHLESEADSLRKEIRDMEEI